MTEYIERDKAINAVFEAFADGRSAYIALEAIPAADARSVKRGKWVQGDMPTYGGYKCSVCGANTVQYKAYFCPNCGADMREES